EVAFTFTKDTRLIWQLPTVSAGKQAGGHLSALRERMRALYGKEQDLLPVDFSAAMPNPDDTEMEAESSTLINSPTSSPSFRLWGFIGKPGVSRSTRDEQHLFVNRRPVENRGLNYALLEGYHTALMKGRYPVCCLFLEIDPAAVDVNIHPSKREIKFHSERAVRQLVANAVRQALLEFHGPPLAARAEIPAQPAKPENRPPAATKEFPQFTPLTGTPLSGWPQRAAKAPPSQVEATSLPQELATISPRAAPDPPLRIEQPESSGPVD